MSIAQCIKRLEDRSPPADSFISLVAIMGVPVSTKNAATEPTDFYFYCLDLRCPDSEHRPLKNESFEDAVARLEAEHRKGIENDA